MRDNPSDGPRPVTLFHYTSQKGLLGIVSDKGLHATNIHYLNDAAEFSYAVELLSAKLFSLKQQAEGKQVVLLDTFERRLSGIRRVGIFVTAFSEKEDVLSLWRGYCPGGGGFSLGFKLADLERRMGPQRFSLARCVYAPEIHNQILGDLTHQIFQNLNPVMFSSPHELDRMLDGFIEKFFYIAPTLKHPSFSEEREWRLISVPTEISDPKVRFRKGVSMLLPYFTFSVTGEGEFLSIPKIVVGPTPHMELSALSTEAFLLANNVQFESVEPSRIPFRIW